MKRGLLLLAALLFSAAPVRADEGMWTFDNIPAAAMRAAYGWAPDAAWLARAMGSAARIDSGCSGAVVSGEGLLQTNHHCVVACVEAFSAPGKDTVSTGLWAETRAAERRCPNLTVHVLTQITDVTDAIERASVGAASFAAARDAEIARLEDACAGHDRARVCEVVTLYQGGQYKLYAYRRYDDVRLVFAPEQAAAFFGGDPDNFGFPRFCFDVAYLRLYENGAPARTPTHVRLREAPPADGEMTLAPGHPGATERFLTTSQLAFQRDDFLPWRVRTLTALRRDLEAFSARGAEERRMAGDTLFSVQNSLKAFAGRRAALMSESGFAHAAAREADLRERVARNAATVRDVGPAWDEISAAMDAYRGFFLAYQYGESRTGEGAQLIVWARDIVRAAAEREKPDAERLPRYSAARLGATAQQTLVQSSIDAPMEELLIAHWLSEMRSDLGANNALVRRVLGGEQPASLARRLVSGTRLGDPAVRQALWEGGAAAVAASDDPMIVFMRGWDDDARAVRTRYQAEVERPVARAQERLARARFRAFGDRIYPDATFTLRLSYGRVAGWTEPSGDVVAPMTTIAGLFARATGQAPYALPPSWLNARSALAGETPFNVTTDTDIIGGNSGSPVLDKDGRVMGVAFDGNAHALGATYFYDAPLSRTVMLTSAAILEGLRDVYHLDALADELMRE